MTNVQNRKPLTATSLLLKIFVLNHTQSQYLLELEQIKKKGYLS